MAWIYILENKINGKCYVGQTCVGFYKRKYAHKISKYPIGHAIRYHGWDSFNIYSFECDEEDLDYFERGFIKQMKSFAPNGYNLESGGNKNKHLSEETKRKVSESKSGVSVNAGRKNPNYGKKLTEEHRIKIGNAIRGRKHSVETRRKLSIMWSGVHNNMYGRHHSEETKMKLSKMNSGKNNILSKKVRCIETDKIYHSQCEASRILNINQANISSCCRGLRNTASGCHWEFYNE